MVRREIQSRLVELSKQFKALLITGPRQSGKTTLTRHAFPDKPYLSLENPDTRSQASQDPRAFLARFREGAILDEAQRVPELFSYLQQVLDESRAPGRFVITGSQHLGLNQTVGQSLAGRVAMLELLPFTHGELIAGKCATADLDTTLFKGSYPPVFDQNLDPVVWYNSYIDTYLQRDVRTLLNVRNLIPFQRFLALCAGNVGQLFNASRIAADCGIASVTASQWLSVLEGSYITFRLQPHFKNFRKRTIKTPKIYFWDTGLAIRLLGVEHPNQIATHPLRGALFENWVAAENMKRLCHHVQRPNLFFWRDVAGLEVDLIQDLGGRLIPTEIKSGSTFASDWTTALSAWKKMAGQAADTPRVVYGGSESFDFQGVQVVSWANLHETRYNQVART